jgi:hypothetical protein
MRISTFGYALGIGVAAALLTGCGGSQTPVGGGLTAAERVSPLQKSDALLYVVNDVNTFYVVDYATGKVRQTITFAPNGAGTGACSDGSGDVFVTEYGGNSESSVQGEILEYRHGGENPVNVLSEGTLTPTSCSVDPASANLAVTNVATSSSGNVAVYPQGENPPTLYSDPALSSYLAATYDDQGNLFVIGKGVGQNPPVQIAELPNGGSSLVNIALNQRINGNRIQWDGRYLAVTDPAASQRTSVEVYRLSVSGSSGVVVDTVRFRSAKGFFAGQVSLIEAQTIVLTLHQDEVGIYKYPAAGNVLRKIGGLARYRKMGLALSN